MAAQILMAVIDEIDNAVKCQFYIVSGVTFNLRYSGRIGVLKGNVKMPGHADTSFPEKNSSAIILPDISPEGTYFAG
jgi:hypothetical protein